MQVPLGVFPVIVSQIRATGDWKGMPDDKLSPRDAVQPGAGKQARDV